MAIIINFFNVYFDNKNFQYNWITFIFYRKYFDNKVCVRDFWKMFLNFVLQCIQLNFQYCYAKQYFKKKENQFHILTNRKTIKTIKIKFTFYTHLWTWICFCFLIIIYLFLFFSQNDNHPAATKDKRINKQENKKAKN